jgi:hypothetical protein
MLPSAPNKKRDWVSPVTRRERALLPAAASTVAKGAVDPLPPMLICFPDARLRLLL